MVSKTEVARVPSWDETLEELLRRGDTSGALEYLDCTLLRTHHAATNHTAALLVLRAQLLRDLGRHAEAAASFRRAGKVVGTKLKIRLVAYFEGARELIGLGRYFEGIEILTVALNEVMWSCSKPLSFRGLEPWEGIVSNLSFDPSAPSAEVTARILLLRAQAARLSKDRQAALQDLSAILDDADLSAVPRAAAYLDRGAILFENGQPSEAIKDFSAILAMDGSLELHKCDAHYNLTLIYAAEGSYDRAVACATAFLGSGLPSSTLKAQLLGSLMEVLADAEPSKAIAVKKKIVSDEMCGKMLPRLG